MSESNAWVDHEKPWEPKPTRVLGFRCPGSGDENEPNDWRYWLWVRGHWADMRIRHRVGLHQWRERWPDGQRHWHCDWCGANRWPR